MQESSTGKPGRPPLEPRIAALEATVATLVAKVELLESQVDRMLTGGQPNVGVNRPLHSAQNATWRQP